MIANGLCGLSFRNNFSDDGKYVPSYVSIITGMKLRQLLSYGSMQSPWEAEQCK